jgi:hypothetical protein
MENNNPIQNTRQKYYGQVNQMGKKEFTFHKMLEYGFWPAHLKSPYEQQENETVTDFERRQQLHQEYQHLADQIAELYQEQHEIDEKLRQLKQEFGQTWDSEKIREDVAKKIMKESVERRAKRKQQKELERAERSRAWQQYRANHIVFIGRGYSGCLGDHNTNKEQLTNLSLPLIEDDQELAALLEIEYRQLRHLAYHRDVMLADHYHFYKIPKRSGGERCIAAPKPLLKQVQRTILTKMLQHLPVSVDAHGFLKEKSVVTGAMAHAAKPQLLINMDIENFFPTITFERVRGLFRSFGYSGYIASILAMLCTYCERMPIEVKGQIRQVKCSDRVLPQGSPASPMITNIICRGLDHKMAALAQRYQFCYSRYADDMSFSVSQDMEAGTLSQMLFQIQKIVKSEGFQVNRNKTHFLKRNNRQSITGVVINNEELGVPRVWIKKMRAALYNAAKLKEQNKLTPSKKNEIAGMASWLCSVNRKRYQSLLTQAKELLRE